MHDLNIGAGAGVGERGPGRMGDGVLTVPGNAPSVFRSQRRVVWVWGCVCWFGGWAEWTMSTVKTPPVEGRRETSPREVEKVERSSWANLTEVALVWGLRVLVLDARNRVGWAWFIQWDDIMDRESAR